MDKPLCLDYLIEEKKPVGQVELLGKRYDLMSVDAVEDLLGFVAVCEKAKAVFESDCADSNVEDMTKHLDDIATRLRLMIRMLVPGLPDEVLRDTFPKVSQLQKFFMAAMMEVRRHAPDSVKKNLDGAANETGRSADPAGVNETGGSAHPTG